MVVYWNFENSSCRTPGSSASGAVGNGSLLQFNTGSFFRAGRGATDFTLIELDDPIDPNFQPFFSGWDRSGADSPTSIGIHHPAVAEKRISFDFDSSTVTSYFETSVPGNGTHVRVAAWEEGTTEPGSSGSPLYNEAGQIIGQLHGGTASCSSITSDWYGALEGSWADGTNSASRLSDWLDPSSTGVQSMDGYNLDESLTVVGGEISEGAAGVETLTFRVLLSEPSPNETITVDYTTEDGTALVDKDYEPSQGSLTFAPGEVEKLVQVTVLDDTTPEEHETVVLRISNPMLAQVTTPTAEGLILNDDYITPGFSGDLATDATVGELLLYQITATNTPTGYELVDPVPSGMMIDEATGTVQWIPMQAGTFMATVQASNPAGMATTMLTITAVNPPTASESLGAAIEAPQLAWQSSLPISWFAQTNDSHDLTDAARSGDIGNNGNTWMRTTVQGPETVRFWWKVSSESSYDYLTVSIDGQLQEQISGTQAWAQVSLDIPNGFHTLEWAYRKDGSISSGQDAGWVDEVRFLNSSSEPFFTNAGSARIPVGQAWAQRFDLNQPGATMSATGLPSWLEFDPESQTLSGTPSAAGTFSVDIEIAGESASTTQPFVIQVEAPIAVGAAVEQSGLAFFQDGGSSWFTQTAVTRDGVDAMASGDIGDNGETQVSTTIMGPGQVSFWWRVDSESSYDFLKFELNGVEEGSESGTSPWRNLSFPLRAGLNQLVWRYTKDGSVSRGADAGYVDEIVLEGYAAWIASHQVDGFNHLLHDQDGDDLSNLLEYAIGSEPGLSDIQELPAMAMINGYRQLSLSKPVGVRDVSFHLEISEDLSAGSWSTMEAEVLQDDAMEFIARDSQPFADENRRFLRLRVQVVE